MAIEADSNVTLNHALNQVQGLRFQGLINEFDLSQGKLSDTLLKIQLEKGKKLDKEEQKDEMSRSRSDVLEAGRCL